jgi:hypothetical protein
MAERIEGKSRQRKRTDKPETKEKAAARNAAV